MTDDENDQLIRWRRDRTLRQARDKAAAARRASVTEFLRELRRRDPGGHHSV